MLVWKRVLGVFTPCGDPCWECPNCGYSHVYGVESFEGPYHQCPQCGEEIAYPYEVDEQNQTEEV